MFSVTNSDAEDLWWPPNKGIFIRGEQKATKEELLKALGQGKKLSAAQEKELAEACKDFESFFLYYLLKVMDRTIPRGEGVFPDTHTMRVYREMWYERLADTISSRGIGLADTMYDQLSHTLLNKVYK